MVNFATLRKAIAKKHPRTVSDADVQGIQDEQIATVAGAAGTVILFDTSGIHRQSTPILEPRDAIFLCYHNSSVPIQQEDVDYYRYHPLLLNAALLGNLTADDERILGFGNKLSYQAGFVRKSGYPVLQQVVRYSHHGCVALRSFLDELGWRLKNVTGALAKRLAKRSK